jgi:hypothetical protein
MAAWWVKIDLLQNYFAIRNVCLRRWQIILTGFSAESQSFLTRNAHPKSGFHARRDPGAAERFDGATIAMKQPTDYATG